MRFKPARLETGAAVVTIVTTAILAAMGAWLAFKMPPPSGWIAAAALSAIIIGCFLWSVKEFRREGDNLIIERMIGTKTVIPLKDIEHAVLIDNFMSMKPMRVFGNGGLFGYYGIFSTAEHGSISCHLTRLHRIIMLRTQGRFYAISPQDDQQFMAMIASSAPNADRRPETMPTLRPETIKYAHPMILLIPDAILVISIIMAVVLYPKLPPIIATHFDGQGTPNGWSTRQSFMVFSLLPCLILFGINVLIFFAIRRRVPDPRVTYFITGLLSFMQLFFAYIMFDIYSFSVRQSHILPLSYMMYILFGAIAVGFILYYRMIRHPH